MTRRRFRRPASAHLVACVAAVLAAPVGAQAPASGPPSAADSAARRDSVLALIARSLDTTDSRLDRPTILPGLSWAPETRLQVGLGGFAITREKRPAQRPDTYAANLLVTQNGQYVLAGNADVWTRDNRLRVETELSASRYPNRFFGIGNRTPSASERYVPTTVQGGVTVQRAVLRGLYLGARVGADRTQLSGIEPGGAIAPRAERDGWSIVSVTAQATWDTRDRLFTPRSGAVASLAVTRSDRAIGSEFPFWRTSLDLRRYVRVAPWAVVAGQGRLDHVSRDVPFDRLPQLGGPMALRGYFAGRFRDRSLGLVQGDLRLGPWWGGVGVAAFGGVGAVAPELAGLQGARWHPAGGVGLRLIDPATGISFRVDFGFAHGGSRGVYVTAGEAF